MIRSSREIKLHAKKKNEKITQQQRFRCRERRKKKQRE